MLCTIKWFTSEECIAHMLDKRILLGFGHFWQIWPCANRFNRQEGRGLYDGGGAICSITTRALKSKHLRIALFPGLAVIVR